MGKAGKKKISVIDKAIKLLSYGDKTKYELGQKLKEYDYSKQKIAEALSEMVRVGLLNDERWLENRLAYIKNVQKRGLYRVKLDLEKRGIAAADIEKKWAEMGLSEMQMAADLARNRMRIGGDKSYKNRQKLARFLGSRGFEWAVIDQVLSELWKE